MEPPLNSASQTEGRRLKVLLIAYACEPGCGSEPGTGWNMAHALSGDNDVTVVTRANNRPAIEGHLATRPETAPDFVFLDPPGWALSLKRSGFMPIQIFYALWQWCVAAYLRKGKAGRYDIIHQLTFNSFEVPPLAFLHSGTATLWGPVGGGQRVPLRLLSAFGLAGGFREWLRNLRVWASAHNPICKLVLKRSSHILFANRETQQLIGACKAVDADLMIDVGVDADSFTPDDEKIRKPGATVLFAGRFEHRKGALLLLKAFERIAAQHPRAKLRLVGGGPLRERLEEYVRRKGLGEKVVFTGLVDHAEMQREMAEADFFAFPSLRDTSGAVVLEAMAMGMPVVCFDHQGAGIMVADGCGLKVPAISTRNAINGLADAIGQLITDPALVSQMGKAARKHVADTHDWASKAIRINQLYRSLVKLPEIHSDTASEKIPTP